MGLFSLAPTVSVQVVFAHLTAVVSAVAVVGRYESKLVLQPLFGIFGLAAAPAVGSAGYA